AAGGDGRGGDFVQTSPKNTINGHHQDGAKKTPIFFVVS
ncbi:unnamed protein product, partial [marine sediment metagenome]